MATKKSKRGTTISKATATKPKRAKGKGDGYDRTQSREMDKYRKRIKRGMQKAAREGDTLKYNALKDILPSTYATRAQKGGYEYSSEARSAIKRGVLVARQEYKNTSTGRSYSYKGLNDATKQEFKKFAAGEHSSFDSLGMPRTQGSGSRKTNFQGARSYYSKDKSKLKAELVISSALQMTRDDWQSSAMIAGKDAGYALQMSMEKNGFSNLNDYLEYLFSSEDGQEIMGHINEFIESQDLTQLTDEDFVDFYHNLMGDITLMAR